MPAAKYTQHHTSTHITHITLSATTVSVHKVHHWRQGYLCCFWLSLPDAFCWCFSLKHFVGAGMHTSTHSIQQHALTVAHGHIIGTHANTLLHTNSLINTHVPHPPCDSSNTHTNPHTVYPHHPWVMNNICLSVPPSLPLAWLLASSWLHCHNVILPASLSPITKMCCDNRAFLHRPLPSHQPGTGGSQPAQRPIKWCGVLFQGCWKYSHGLGQDFTWWVLLFYCEKNNWLPGIARFGSL